MRSITAKRSTGQTHVKTKHVTGLFKTGTMLGVLVAAGMFASLPISCRLSYRFEARNLERLPCTLSHTLRLWPARSRRAPPRQLVDPALAVEHGFQQGGHASSNTIRRDGVPRCGAARKPPLKVLPEAST